MGRSSSNTSNALIQNFNNGNQNNNNKTNTGNKVRDCVNGLMFVTDLIVSVLLLDLFES